ncbi:hypothetical protein K1T71_006049 [Dendrolimus kikuchii]|uniref:Uncharacterized protein n=1 Tax=Dendrolimus kikuchii TaxID=765133 RepID=A0ACC1D303_9NEOP|nr:hypothetical protein K1T71_006049 [Dendrolimus kikuchii]
MIAQIWRDEQVCATRSPPATVSRRAAASDVNSVPEREDCGCSHARKHKRSIKKLSLLHLEFTIVCQQRTWHMFIRLTVLSLGAHRDATCSVRGARAHEADCSREGHPAGIAPSDRATGRYIVNRRRMNGNEAALMLLRLTLTNECISPAPAQTSPRTPAVPGPILSK